MPTLSAVRKERPLLAECGPGTLTHPISWPKHRLLLRSQLVEDVVGYLHAPCPQFACSRRHGTDSERLEASGSPLENV